MSLPLLSASAFQDLLDLVNGGAVEGRPKVPAEPTPARPTVDPAFEQQFFVDWEVPQAS